MKNDCAYKEKCMQIMTMQMLAMYAGRSLACAPSCEYCNIYKPVERKEKNGCELLIPPSVSRFDNLQTIVVKRDDYNDYCTVEEDCDD